MRGKTRQKSNYCRHKLAVFLLPLLLTLTKAEAKSAQTSPDDSQYQTAVRLATTLSQNIKNCTPGNYPILMPKHTLPIPTEPSEVKYREETYIISGYNKGKCAVNIGSKEDRENKRELNCQYSQATLDFIADNYLKTTIIDFPLKKEVGDEKTLDLVVQMINECAQPNPGEKVTPPPQADSH